MDHLGNHFLARPALAQDQHRRIGRRDDRRGFEDAAHGLALADQPRRQLGQSFVARCLLDRADGVGNGRLQLVQIDRLGQVVVGAALHCGHRLAEVGVGGDQEHGQLVGDLADFGQGLDAAHAGQPHVQQNHVGRAAADRFQGLFGRGSLFGTEAERLDEPAQQSALCRLVVHHQDRARFVSHGFHPTRKWRRRRGEACSRPPSHERRRCGGRWPAPGRCRRLAW